MRVRARIQVARHEEGCMGALDHPRRLAPPTPAAMQKTPLPARSDSRRRATSLGAGEAEDGEPGPAQAAAEEERASRKSVAGKSLQAEYYSGALIAAKEGAAKGAAAAVEAGLSVADGALAVSACACFVCLCFCVCMCVHLCVCICVYNVDTQTRAHTAQPDAHRKSLATSSASCTYALTRERRGSKCPKHAEPYCIHLISSQGRNYSCRWPLNLSPGHQRCGDSCSAGGSEGSKRDRCGRGSSIDGIGGAV